MATEGEEEEDFIHVVWELLPTHLLARSVIAESNRIGDYTPYLWLPPWVERDIMSSTASKSTLCVVVTPYYVYQVSFNFGASFYLIDTSRLRIQVSGGADSLAVALDTCIEGCSDVNISKVFSAEERAYYHVQGKDSSECLKQNSLEANLSVKNPCEYDPAILETREFGKSDHPVLLDFLFKNRPHAGKSNGEALVWY